MSETRAFRSFFVDELLFVFTTYRTLTNSRSFRHACVRACVRAYVRARVRACVREREREREREKEIDL